MINADFPICNSVDQETQLFKVTKQVFFCLSFEIALGDAVWGKNISLEESIIENKLN